MAQFYLASLYKDGKGVAADPDQCVYWYSQAAEQGYAPAQTVVGVIYLMGEQNVRPDSNKGVSWLPSGSCCILIGCKVYRTDNKTKNSATPNGCWAGKQ